MIQTSAAHVLLAAGLLMASESSPAQRTMHRCTSEGRVYLSDRACEGRPATNLASIGPAPGSRSEPPSRDRPGAKASEVLDYLSPECAELREGLRNGPGRGLGSRAYGELSASYHQRCGEEEQNAQRRLSDERSKKRELREREVAAENVERDRARLTREQCEPA